MDLNIKSLTISGTNFRLISYSLSFVIAVLLLELSARYYYSPTQLLYLPYYGLSKDQHSLLIWQNQPEKNHLGTLTTPYSFDEYDAELGWKVKSNVDVMHSKPSRWEVNVSTNSYGLRGNNLQQKRNLNQEGRIGFIGASQTFGESVNDDEVYVSILNNILKNFEVLNFGVRGYGTDQMLLYYENEVSNYDLDITILAFAFHHMPRNTSKFTFYAKPYFVKSNNDLLLSGSPVPSEFDLFDKEVEKGNSSLLNKSVLLRIALKYFKVLNTRKIYNEESNVWTTTKLIITRFAKVVEQNDSLFVLLNIEHKHKALEPALQELANELDVDLINLGPTIREKLSSGVLAQIPNDNHWSAVGHQLVADAIYENLCHKHSILQCE